MFHHQRPRGVNRTLIVRINICLVMLISVSSFMNLVFANNTVTKRHEIAMYRKELESLNAEHQRLSLKTIELSSSERITDESRRLNLVRANDVYYITPKGSVAMNQ